MPLLTNIRCIVSDHVLIVVHSCEWNGPVQGRNNEHFLEEEEEGEGRERGMEGEEEEERDEGRGGER